MPPNKLPTKPDKQINALRDNLDMQDIQKDGKRFIEELEKKNTDFIAQIKGILDKNGEYAGCVFSAIDETTKQFKVHPIELIKLLGLPPLKKLTVSAKIDFDDFDEMFKFPDLKSLTPDEQYKIYKDYYIFKRKTTVRPTIIYK